MGDRVKYVLFLLGFISVLQADVVRAEGVQARYLENSGSTTVLELLVEDPPPSSVIVMQQIPAGMRIRNALPAYMKYDAGKGQVKWLFRRPKAGVQRIRLQYEHPLAGGGATAVIRCKSPVNGKLMTVTVQ